MLGEGEGCEKACWTPCELDCRFSARTSTLGSMIGSPLCPLALLLTDCSMAGERNTLRADLEPPFAKYRRGAMLLSLSLEMAKSDETSKLLDFLRGFSLSS